MENNSKQNILEKFLTEMILIVNIIIAHASENTGKYDDIIDNSSCYYH